MLFPLRAHPSGVLGRSGHTEAAVDLTRLAGLRPEEGGIGLRNKLRVYELPDRGADTVEANVALGLPVDARRYAAGARCSPISASGPCDCSVTIRPNRPGLEEYGVTVVRRLPLQATPTEYNIRYLRAKRDRMDHQLSGVDAEPARATSW